MGTTILAQWLDIAQRVHVARQHLRSVRNELLVDEHVDTRYVHMCAQITSELRNIEQEISYLYETLLQAQAALSPLMGDALESKANA